MATAKKATARRKPAAPEPAKCPVCKGSGEVSRTVRVGRRQRVAGQQTGICLNCLGSGEIPADD
ncbi:hypothetical protein DI272_29695 [Streptomyces sp. Act143]|uniref:hypothetical protein n=1 Tax=Streptomyces sp. Act143 TaxID=2200760 RepID=UPI000D6770AD|nr:hypothetical protein [Streptomyces sp. Act143]PWI20737.1 hypothetical protein DI272_29695 [Streptomyces sp. Act143]